MTGTEFREQHGDPAGWMPADFDSFEVVVLTDNEPGTPDPCQEVDLLPAIHPAA